MGLLDDALGNAVPGGNLSKPLMIALGALLVGKMLHGSSSSAAPPQPTASPDDTVTASASGAPEGGLFGGLGGLLNKLQDAGHGDKVNSWVGPGQNAPIQPGQLGAALGQRNVSALAQQAGVNEQDLLSQLSAALPGVIDKLTANGTIPNSQQLAAMFGGQQGR